MRTITISVHNEKDADILKSVLKDTKFTEEVEVYEDTDEYSAEDIAEWDRRLAAFEKDPSRGRSGDDFIQEMKQKYGL